MNDPGASERNEDDAVGTGSWRAWHADPETARPLRVGVSRCLLGEDVRYDGGHARDRWVMGHLGRFVEWAAVCPEVEIGMPIPRPTIRLEEEADGSIRLRESASRRDHTEAMDAHSRARAGALVASGLDGFVLKSRSPSCGLERVKVHDANDVRQPRKAGRGRFATALVAAAPELPMEEEGRLNDAVLRENFVERLFARARWRAFLDCEPNRGRLVKFHTAHKLLLFAHDEQGARDLGRLLGEAAERPFGELLAAYGSAFAAIMAVPATRGRHGNVLEHAAGHLKDLLDPREKRELHAVLADHRSGILPLIVPMTLMRFALRKYEVQYLLGQLYFDPHPKELMLRNHA